MLKSNVLYSGKFWRQKFLKLIFTDKLNFQDLLVYYWIIVNFKKLIFEVAVNLQNNKIYYP